MSEPLYGKRRSWARRLALAQERAPENVFLEANVDLALGVLSNEETGVSMVVNIGAEALLSYLTTGIYMNVYDGPIVDGARREPTEQRVEVDQLLGFGGHGHRYFFGAVAVGGVGVRYYGEYCMVLRRTVIPATTQVFDRDSYDLLLPPLSEEPDRAGVVRALRGQWARDVASMVAFHMVPHLATLQRLVTAGTVSDLTLCDQEFIEVHLKKRFTPGDLEEIRVPPEQAAIAADILERFGRGVPPTPEELLWNSRRLRAQEAIAAAGLPLQIVTGDGRGYDWT